ncbi:hypothetical protein GCM10011591_30400 [Nocardia camponoti]|uniref:Uncharacterized protein n=1 Tax=Nocardia camponoti TaxID=1616106 RepID=A0A917QLT8_9NOCA|nr:hypothetical protein GCM10011591_30400 [Nocardia camponoti]
MLKAEVHAAVAGKGVEFDERTLVDKGEDALTRGHLALGVHLVYCGFTHRVLGFGEPIPQISQLPGGGVDIGGARRFRCGLLLDTRHGSRV